MCLPWHAESLCRGPRALAHPFGCPSTTSGGLLLQRRFGRIVAPCSPMATGGAAAGNLNPCLWATARLHPGFRGDGDPAYGPSLVVGSCQFVTMNWASEIRILKLPARPAEPVTDHGVPSLEACSRKQTQRSISTQISETSTWSTCTTSSSSWATSTLAIRRAVSLRTAV